MKKGDKVLVYYYSNKTKLLVTGLLISKVLKTKVVLDNGFELKHSGKDGGLFFGHDRYSSTLVKLEDYLPQVSKVHVSFELTDNDLLFDQVVARKVVLNQLFKLKDNLDTFFKDVLVENTSQFEKIFSEINLVSKILRSFK